MKTKNNLYVCGGGKRNRVKLISLALISSLALSGAFFFSCANASGGGTESNVPTETVSRVIWTCATSEEEAPLGNKVSEVLCLFNENKFELQKYISYFDSEQNENISFFQTFYKGTYQGSIRDGMTFEIKEELDINDFDDEMKQVFNLKNTEAKNARLASDAISRSAMPAARAASRSTAVILAECKTKLKEAKFKTAENKTISLETGKDSVTLTNADGNKKEVTEKAIGGFINLDGFLFTGNPCNTRTNENSPWRWANTEEEGAKILKKTADGKYTCQFRADDNDTLIRIIWNNWAADWGLSSIDKEKSTLPSGVGITDDAHAVNNKEGFEQYQDSRNIAITRLEAKRKYDITFDTKKSPGKICIELAEHKISTLDGWLFSGSPTGWAGNTADGALPLDKVGNTWQVSFTANKGWCGFRLCKPKWEDEIGWSSFDWKDQFDIYNVLRGSNAEKYALEDDDNITFRSWDNLNFEGTEKITLTFGLNNGRVTCETNIQYAEEFDLDLYDKYGILASEPDSDGMYPELSRGDIESNRSFSFSMSKSSVILAIRHLIKEDGDTTWYQPIDLQRMESVDLPSGAKWSLGNYYGGVYLTGFVSKKTYNVQLKKGNKTGYFKIIITEQ